MSLTDIQCKAAKTQDKPYKLNDGEGLFLLVHSNGSKYWRLKYRLAGKEKLLALGVYPQVTISEAREKRADARKLIAKGTDPSQNKKQEKRLLALNIENSFESVAREWHNTHRHTWSEGHAHDILRRLENDIFREIGKRPVAEIGTLELLDVIKKIEKRGAHVMAHRAMQYCNKIFRYAVITCKVDRNPAIDLAGALKPAVTTHYAALELKDLPEFLQRLEKNDARLFLQTRLGVKFLLLTFVRTGELINAKWEEFNLPESEWIIPADRMKMKRPHIVPLSKQALQILTELKNLNPDTELLFPSRTNPAKPMGNNTILFALARLGYKGKATGHGFRALAMTTIKEKLGYRHEVIDRQLAHAPENKIVAAYDRAKFLDERKKMMQEWGDYVNSLTSSNQ